MIDSGFYMETWNIRFFTIHDGDVSSKWPQIMGSSLIIFGLLWGNGKAMQYWSWTVGPTPHSVCWLFCARHVTGLERSNMIQRLSGDWFGGESLTGKADAVAVCCSDAIRHWSSLATRAADIHKPGLLSFARCSLSSSIGGRLWRKGILPGC